MVRARPSGPNSWLIHDRELTADRALDRLDIVVSLQFDLRTTLIVEYLPHFQCLEVVRPICARARERIISANFGGEFKPDGDFEPIHDTGRQIRASGTLNGKSSRLPPDQLAAGTSFDGK